MATTSVGVPLYDLLSAYHDALCDELAEGPYPALGAVLRELKDAIAHEKREIEGWALVLDPEPEGEEGRPRPRMGVDARGEFADGALARLRGVLPDHVCPAAMAFLMLHRLLRCYDADSFEDLCFYVRLADRARMLGWEISGNDAEVPLQFATRAASEGTKRWADVFRRALAPRSYPLSPTWPK